MLRDLIQCIENSIIHFVKMNEGLNYAGNGVYSLELFEQSRYLSKERKLNIHYIDLLCREATQFEQSPKELATHLLNYVNSFNSFFGRIFGYLPDIRRVITQAITQYYPDLILFKGRSAIINPKAPSFRPNPKVEPIILPAQDLLDKPDKMTELITNLMQTIQSMREEITVMKKQIAEQDEKNEHLEMSLTKANLEIMKLTQQSTTPAEEIEKAATPRMTCAAANASDIEEERRLATTSLRTHE